MLFKLIFKVTACLQSLIFSCNGNTDNMARLIDGKNAEQKDWYFMASLYQKSGYSPTEVTRICGGVIITKWHILTAAHCLFTDYAIELKPEDIVVVAGSTNIEMFLDLKDRKKLVAARYVQSWAIHPKYNHKKVDNDIAILKFRERLIFERFDPQEVGPIPLETMLTKPEG